MHLERTSRGTNVTVKGFGTDLLQVARLVEQPGAIAEGLGAKAADANGMVTWTWNIGRSTRRGSGTVVLTCNGATTTSPIQIG